MGILSGDDVRVTRHLVPAQIQKRRKKKRDMKSE